MGICRECSLLRDIIKVLTFLIIDSQTCDQIHLEKIYEKRSQEVFLCYNK